MEVGLGATQAHAQAHLASSEPGVDAEGLSPGPSEGLSPGPSEGARPC